MNRNVTAFILLVLAIGIYVTFTSNLWDEVKSVREINNQYIQAIDNADRLITVRGKVLNDYNALSPNDIDRLQKMLPIAVDNIRLVIDLNSIAQKNGLTLKGVKASMANDGSKTNIVPVGNEAAISVANIDTINVSFSTSASYEQFKQFMRDLEANLRLMDMVHLNVVANDSGVYDYSINLKTYWLRQ